MDGRRFRAPAVFASGAVFGDCGVDRDDRGSLLVGPTWVRKVFMRDLGTYTDLTSTYISLHVTTRKKALFRKKSGCFTRRRSRSRITLPSSCSAHNVEKGDLMRTISALFLALAIGCGTQVSEDPSLPGGETDDPADNPGDPGTPPLGEPEPCAKMDIVFVIDDSGSMSEEQSNLVANFPAFFDVIDNHTNSLGQPLDYRIAVTTTGRDVDYTLKIPPPFDLEIPTSESGDNGAFRQDCGMTRPWIERSDANVQDTFECLAQVGTGGPSLEMPLYALELGFTERIADGQNAQFLRNDALLATVILTDEDDCSRTDNDFELENDQCGQGDPDYLTMEHSVQFLDGLTGHRSRWATAVIAGPQDCSSSFGDAVEASRLKDFVSQTGANGTFSSICDGDLSISLADALDNFDAACDEFIPPVN